MLPLKTQAFLKYHSVYILLPFNLQFTPLLYIFFIMLKNKDFVEFIVTINP